MSFPDHNPDGSEVVYIVNQSGAIHSATADHPAVRVLRSQPVDDGDLATYQGFHIATPAELAVGREADSTHTT